MNKNKLFWTLLDAVCIAVGSITFFMFFSNFAANIIVNGGTNLLFNIPYHITTLASTGLFVSLILSEFLVRKERGFFLLGLINMAINFVVLLIDLIFLASKFDGNFLLDGPIQNYPLFVVILASLSILVSLCVLLNSKKLIQITPEKSFDKPILSSILFTLILLLAFFYTSNFVIGIITFDDRFNYFGQVVVLLLMLVPLFEVLIYLFAYKARPIDRRLRNKMRHSLYLFGYTSVLYIIVGIYEASKPSFVVESMQATFPLTFAASIPVTFIFIALLGIIMPAIIFVVNLIKIKKGK